MILKGDDINTPTVREQHVTGQSVGCTRFPALSPSFLSFCPFQTSDVTSAFACFQESGLVGLVSDGHHECVASAHSMKRCFPQRKQDLKSEEDRHVASTVANQVSFPPTRTASSIDSKDFVKVLEVSSIRNFSGVRSVFSKRGQRPQPLHQSMHMIFIALIIVEYSIVITVSFVELETMKNFPTIHFACNFDFSS